MAPILPHIEDESSVENFNKKITSGALKLSFEANHFDDSDYKKKIDSEELLDFDFVEEDFVETAVHDSYSTSPTGLTRKFNHSNDMQKLQEVIKEEGIINLEDMSQTSEEEAEGTDQEKPVVNIELHERVRSFSSSDEEKSRNLKNLIKSKDYKGGDYKGGYNKINKPL